MPHAPVSRTTEQTIVGEKHPEEKLLFVFFCLMMGLLFKKIPREREMSEMIRVITANKGCFCALLRIADEVLSGLLLVGFKNNGKDFVCTFMAFVICSIGRMTAASRAASTDHQRSSTSSQRSERKTTAD